MEIPHVAFIRAYSVSVIRGDKSSCARSRGMSRADAKRLASASASLARGRNV